MVEGSLLAVELLEKQCDRENHHPMDLCSSLASMIQIAALDTHSNTMATVLNCDVTQHKVDCEPGLSDHKLMYGELPDRFEHWGVTT